MRWQAGLAVLGLVAATAAEAGPVRDGRVVRVERPRVEPATFIHFCNISNVDEPLMCWGRAPQIGDRGTWMHYQKQVVARLRVLRTRPHPQDTCGLGQMHQVDVAVRSLGSGPPSGYPSLAIFNAGLTRDATYEYGAQLSAPSGDPDDQVILSIDRDGEGNSDMLVTMRDCARTAPEPPPPARGRVRGAKCLSYWLQEEGRWHREQEEVLYECR